MAFQETELHKLHLRLAALEGKPLSCHLLPSLAVIHGSSVRLPEPEAAPEAAPDEPTAAEEPKRSKKGKG